MVFWLGGKCYLVFVLRDFGLLRRYYEGIWRVKKESGKVDFRGSEINFIWFIVEEVMIFFSILVCVLWF